MGMYTEIFFRAELVKDLPEEALSALHTIVGGAPNPKPNPGHELFDCPRWDILGTGSSAYFPAMAKSSLGLDFYSKQHQLLVHGNIKNYHDEIGKFFDWIQTYVDEPEGTFIGYSLYEESETPTIFVKK